MQDKINSYQQKRVFQNSRQSLASNNSNMSGNRKQLQRTQQVYRVAPVKDFKLKQTLDMQPDDIFTENRNRTAEQFIEEYDALNNVENMSQYYSSQVSVNTGRKKMALQSHYSFNSGVNKPKKPKSNRMDYDKEVNDLMSIKE